MSIQDTPQNYALPSTAQLKLKPSGVPAVRKRLNIQPYQYPTGAITSNSVIQFYIPARRNTMYDPATLYLKGTISNLAGTTQANIRLNRNAFSLVNRLQVYGQDSTLLEDIQNYNDLCHTLIDVQMSREDKFALSSMYAGSADSTTITNGLVSGQAGGALPNTGNAGVAYNALVVTSSLNNAIDYGNKIGAGSANFCIPVVSAFGLLADNLIPTGWLNSDLRLDFYTELPNVAFREHDDLFANANAVTSYQLSNLELVCDQIEFDPSAMQLVQEYAPVGQPVYLHATTYKTYTNTLANGTSGFFSQLLPHRSLSVKQVLSSSHIANANGYDSFARILPYGSSNLQIGLNIGGQKFPQKPVQTVAEAFAELQKSQHAFNQLILNGSINRTEYTKFLTDNSSVANALTCKPVIGFDLEKYDKKGNTIINGSNFTGLNVFIEGYVARNSAGDALNAVVTQNNFVGYDVIYVIQDGTISVRF